MRFPRAGGRLRLSVPSAASRGRASAGPLGEHRHARVSQPSLGMGHSWGFGKQPGWPCPGQLRPDWSHVQPLESDPLVLPFTLPVFLWYCLVFFIFWWPRCSSPGAPATSARRRARPEFALSEQELGDNEAALGHLCLLPLPKPSQSRGWSCMALCCRSASSCVKGSLCVYLLKPDLVPPLPPRRTNPGMTTFPQRRGPSPHPVLRNARGCLRPSPNAWSCHNGNGPAAALLAPELLGVPGEGLVLSDLQLSLCLCLATHHPCFPPCPGKRRADPPGAGVLA